MSRPDVDDPTTVPMPSPLTHAALRYATLDDYRAGVLPFIEAGLTADEPVLAFAMSPNLDVLRDGLNATSDLVTLLDAAEMPSNPSCIIPAARHFAEAHGGRPVRIVGEPGWPGRSAAALQEVVRHEALVNLLLADVAAAILCPYNTADLDADSIADACRTHPHLVTDDGSQPSSLYTDPLLTLAATHHLSDPPGQADLVTVELGDLAGLRQMVRSHAGGISEDRVQDLLVAVTEAASNSRDYAGRSGILRSWREPGVLIFEISDHGEIPEFHLAGRIEPPLDALRGRGLWIINQMCDLVELRSSAAGTVIRMHFSLA